MAAISSQYLRRRKLLAHGAVLEDIKQRAITEARAHPHEFALKEAVYLATEACLLNDEKLEYLEALIDESRAPSRKQRPPGAPSPDAILLRQVADREARGVVIDSPARQVVNAPRVPKPERPLNAGFITFEQVRIATDEKQEAKAQKDADRAARKMLRKLKARIYARKYRAAKRNAQQ